MLVSNHSRGLQTHLILGDKISTEKFLLAPVGAKREEGEKALDNLSLKPDKIFYVVLITLQQQDVAQTDSSTYFKTIFHNEARDQNSPNDFHIFP